MKKIVAVLLLSLLLFGFFQLLLFLSLPLFFTEAVEELVGEESYDGDDEDSCHDEDNVIKPLLKGASSTRS